MAAARSFGSAKTLAMIASVAGKMKAAPIPISARLTMRAPADPTDPATTDVIPKATRPTMSERLRPKRSPSPPAARSSPVKTRR